MKISIDTQQDSQYEIRKAIKLLMSLVGDKEVYTNEVPRSKNIFEDSPSPSQDSGGNIFGNMFSDDPPNPVPEPEPTPTPEMHSEVVNDVEEEEDSVELY